MGQLRPPEASGYTARTIGAPSALSAVFDSVPMMRRSAFIFGLAFLTSACSLITDPRKAVLLFVQDVVVPNELAPGTELVATITVMTGGCKMFERFETSRAGDRLTVVARGTDMPNQVCTDDIRYEPHEYRVTVPSGN